MKKIIWILTLIISTFIFSGFAMAGEPLEANEYDIANLEKDLNGKYDLFSADEYDCQNYNFYELIQNIVYSLSVTGEAQGIYVPDPLNKISGDWEYYKIPADKMDNILVNIFHAEPNHSFNMDFGGYCNGYYYNGYYYYQIEGTGGTGREVSVVNYERQPDGKYNIVWLESYPDGNEYYWYMIADLQDIDGVRTWTFYRTSHTHIFDNGGLDSGIDIYIDGEAILFLLGEGPVIYNNRVYVPVRRTCEYLGVDVSFDNNEGRMYFYKNGRIVSHIKNTSTVYVDGYPVYFDTPSITVNNRILMPIRMLAESIGSSVTWDDAARSVYMSR